MSTPTRDISVAVLQKVRRTAVDGIFKASPFLGWCEKTGCIERSIGGKSIGHPTILADHSSITNLGGGGYTPTSEVVEDPLRMAEFDWSNSTKPVYLTKVEEMANRGDEARVDIMAARLKSVLGTFKNEMEKQIFAGTSVGLYDIQSLNGIDAATGWLEEVAFGSQANSVGGLSKATYTVGWNNQSANANSAFTTDGLSAMSSVLIGTMSYVQDGEVDGIFASPTSFKLYKDSLQSQEQYLLTDKTLDAGRLALSYAGAPMFVQKDLGFTGSGGNKFSMVFLNSKSLTLYFDPDGEFTLDDPVPAGTTLAHRQDVILRAQLCASHLASMGLVYNAEA